MPIPAPAADQSRSLLSAAASHQARNEHAERIRDDVLYGLRHFSDTFLEAIGGEFLADADEHTLRDQRRRRPAALQRNQRCLSAQRALHSLYGKLNAGVAMTLEERALAEHAHDLCEHYTQREIERRAFAAGL